MEVSSLDCDLDVRSIYENLLPEIECGLEKIEEDPAFLQERTRTSTIEIALTVLKNGKTTTYKKILHQHHWSWLTFGLSILGAPIIPLLYLHYHGYRSTYSKEKTLDLIRDGFKELLTHESITDSDLLNCVIVTNTANPSFFSWGYWLFFKDLSTEICSHSFIPKQLQNLVLGERESFRNSSIVSDLILEI
jgi:hypothetical protein